ncbi:MAG: hypothetical protein IH846_15145 [Acidobacteria bacterium]|nr:hypothetical protein [Acidobacteriota bacterium]
MGALPGAVGEEVLDFLRDVVDVPRRILSTITRQPEQFARIRIMQERVGVLKKSGLSDQQAREQILQEFHEGKLPEISGTINPDEAAAALDIAFLGIPLGKVAQPVARAVGRKVFERTAGTRIRGFLAERGISLPGLVEETIRAGASGAKLGGAIPPREIAGDVKQRAETAAVVGGLSSFFPGLGAAVRVTGVPEAIGKATQKVSKRVFGKTNDQVLAKAAREELRTLIRSKSVTDILEKEGNQLRSALSAVSSELDDIGRITLEEAPAITATGTVGQAAKAPLREAARELPGRALAVSPQRVRTINTAITVLADQVEELASQVAGRAGNAAAAEQAVALTKLMNFAGTQRARLARTFGLTGRAFQEPVSLKAKTQAKAAVDTLVNTLRRAELNIEGLPALESGPAKTLFREGLDALKERNLGRAARIFGIDFWRRAIFPWGSFLADLPSNVGSLTEIGGRAAVDDLFQFIKTGTPGQRVAAHFDAIRFWRQFPKRELEAALGRDPALSLRFKPFFGEKADIAVFTGLKLKTLTDGTAQSLAFKVVLLQKARTEAVVRGLAGVSRQNYVRNRIVSLLQDKAAVSSALVEAQRASFTLPLPRSIERLTANPFFILFISPFGRFAVQWLRFLAEFTPASPSFAKALLTGKATSADAVNFATRNLAGAGFVQFTNEVIYDEVDWDRFEYLFKDLDGNVVRRKSLRGIPFISEALFVSALLRGDSEKARKAATSTSVTILSSPGIASRVLEGIRQWLDGRSSTKAMRRQIEELVASYFPQRTAISFFDSFFSPEERDTGFRGIPVLEESGRVRIDPFTGEPKVTKRFVTGTDIEVPPAVGSRVFSTELSPEEEFLRSVGIKGRFTTVRFPQIQTVGADKPSDTSPEIQERFERIWGKLHGQLVAGLRSEFGNRELSPEQKNALQKIYRQQRSLITKIAKAQLQTEGVRLAGEGTFRDLLERNR